ncbi:hypothetical protein [Liquorilactobacillus hordei]|uniref:hypothetical protein n=1 Tax=Liquorilactobacillus hordei TaxID=468911 RepID=UPI001CBB165F|nr:hypothetical protein [Liquorilactobacillus hordei]MBZ2405722.1 hypothetical protein [Liquorilactobacillus hordei]
MLIDDQKNKLSDVITTQIMRVIFPFIIARSVTGQLLTVKLSRKERWNPILWRTLQSICEAKLWIPITNNHRLLQNDWLI